MRFFKRRTYARVLLFVLGLPLAGCGFPRVPDPIKVLENPKTGERARFFREIPFKVPKDYDETKHLAEWSAQQGEAGFTKEITPVNDRAVLLEIRRRNLAATHR